MGGLPCNVVGRLYRVLLACVMLATFGSKVAFPQETPALYLVADDLPGYPGEAVSVPIGLQTLADSLDGFTIVLNLIGPDLTFFEVDTVVIGEETVYICAFDTVGTLCSGWQYLAARSIGGDGRDIRITGIADLGSGTTTGIPDYTTGILINIPLRIRGDLVEPLAIRDEALDFDTTESYYSNSFGQLIEPVDHQDGTVRVLEVFPGDVNCDGNLNPVDVVLLVNYVYKSFALSECGANHADFNCDGLTNPVDVVTIVNTVYKGWERPLCP